jgi:hypothetical protein
MYYVPTRVLLIKLAGTINASKRGVYCTKAEFVLLQGQVPCSLMNMQSNEISDIYYYTVVVPTKLN